MTRKTRTVNYELGIDEVRNLGINQYNRQISRPQVAKLKKEMKDCFDTMPAVVVNVRTNNIIDGQHRTEAYLELMDEGVFEKGTRLLVMYVDIDEAEERERIIRANTHTRQWTVDDYIDSYTTENKEDYVRLKTWCIEHELANEKGKPKFRYGAAIITGKNCSKALKAGEFTATEEEFERADVVHAEMKEIIDIFRMPRKGAFIEQLAIKWVEIREQNTFDEWIRAFSKMTKQVTAPKPGSGTQNDWEIVFSWASNKIRMGKK